MKELSIGMIDYINALPFFAAFQKGVIKWNASFVKGVPSEMNTSLKNHEVDVALISSSEYLKHRDNYELLPGLCLGALGKVASVSLFTRKPLYELDDEVIAITTHSQTSVALLRVLCHHFWKISPKFVPLRELADAQRYSAFLLIGDQCLQNPKIREFSEIDLSEAWYHSTGLPFTFAVFATHKETAQNHPYEIAECAKKFHEALQWARNNKAIIEEMAFEKSHLGRDMIRDYFHLLRYQMSPKQKTSLDKFGKLLSLLPDEQYRLAEASLYATNSI